MISTKRFNVGTSERAGFEVAANMKAETRVVGLQEQPDKKRVAVMLFGRPGIYHAPSSETELIEQLRSAHAAGKSIPIEWDPNSLRILRAGPS